MSTQYITSIQLYDLQCVGILLEVSLTLGRNKWGAKTFLYWGVI